MSLISHNSRKDAVKRITVKDTYACKRMTVLDSKMAYVDEGEGDAVVFYRVTRIAKTATIYLVDIIDY